MPGWYSCPTCPTDTPTFDAGRCDDCFLPGKTNPALEGDSERTYAEFKADVYHVVNRCQIHTCQGVCFKYQNKTCRFNYPRPVMDQTAFVNGVILQKRLHSTCNNYNKAISAIMRCNTDVKFLTNGQDAKATIFYITDYITKNEMSVFQTVSLIQLAFAKIEANEFPTASCSFMTEEEDKARKLLYTCLNTMDKEVERSAQFVVSILLGYPLEYTSHTYKSFTPYSFIRAIKVANPPPRGLEDPSNPNVDEFVEVTTPVITPQTSKEKDDGVYPTLKTVNKLTDYTHRSTVNTDRSFKTFHIPENDTVPFRAYQPFHASHPYDNLATELAQLSPLDYEERVTKTRITRDMMKDAETPFFFALPSNGHLYHHDHPQYSTHYQRILNTENPRVPHPIPMLQAFVLPSVSTSREDYYASVLAVLTPWTDPSSICEPLPDHDDDDKVDDDDDDEPKRLTFEEAYAVFMSALRAHNPFKAKDIEQTIRNMESIRQGKDQVKLDRIERERLRAEQGIEVVKVPEDGMDFNSDTDNLTANYTGSPDTDVLETLRDRAPRGPPVDHAYLAETRQLTEDRAHEAVHRMITAERHRIQILPEVDVLLTLNAFQVTLAEQLQQKKDAQMHIPTPITQPQRIIKDNVDPLEIASRLGLDERQTDAFILILAQALRVRIFKAGLSSKPPKQMVMFLAGEGGTGKSKVVLALTETMEQLRIRHTLRLAAFTGVAASNINGCTLHSMLKRKGDNDKTPKRPNETIKTTLQDVDTFFIDEVSMLDCQLMHHFNSDLNRVHPHPLGHDPNIPSPGIYFGGKTIIFAGDFRQLTPVGGIPLFVKNLKKPDYAYGYFAFNQVSSYVELKNQYRIPPGEYRDVVSNFREGKISPKTLAYLEHRRIHDGNTVATGTMRYAKKDPIIITTTNEARYAFNVAKVAQVAAILKQKVLICVSIDTYETPLSTVNKLVVLQRPGCGANKYTEGLLPMFPGMAVTIKRNVAPELGISNGSTGIIHKIVLNPAERVNLNADVHIPHYLQYQPLAVYVEMDATLDDAGNKRVLFQIDGLPANVFPMSTLPSFNGGKKALHHYTVPVEVADFKAVRMMRRQYIFVPGYAITVWQSQGRTLMEALLYFGKPTKVNKKRQLRLTVAYVMASRVRHGDNIGILGQIPTDIFPSLLPDPAMLTHGRKTHDILVTQTDKDIAAARAQLENLIRQFRRVE